MQTNHQLPFECVPAPAVGPGRALLLFISLYGGALPLKITIASDSTAAYFPPTDYGKRTGWGQVLSNFFNTNVVVVDLASSGRSSKSFCEEGKWAACLATHADYYFIQFGHNDGKTQDPARYTDPETTFKSYLSNYIHRGSRPRRHPRVAHAARAQELSIGACAQTGQSADITRKPCANWEQT